MAPPQISPFEKLSAEIRMMIYECLLVTPKGMSLRCAPEKRAQMGTSVIPPRHEHLLEDREPVSILPDPSTLRITLWSGTEILGVSKTIYQEALPILYSRNKFHYSSLVNTLKYIAPCGFISIVTNDPQPIPFSTEQLFFIKHLSLDYCIRSQDIYVNYRDSRNQELHLDAMDDFIGEHIEHIDRSCPSLKTLTLHHYSRTPLPELFERLRCDRAAQAIRVLTKRIEYLHFISPLKDSILRILAPTVAPIAAWKLRERSELPGVSISPWQLEGMKASFEVVRAWTLDCRKSLQICKLGH
jgi:hypothetical protein